jgi:hypothetical protein
MCKNDNFRGEFRQAVAYRFLMSCNRAMKRKHENYGYYIELFCEDDLPMSRMVFGGAITDFH